MENKEIIKLIDEKLKKIYKFILILIVMLVVY